MCNNKDCFNTYLKNKWLSVCLSGGKMRARHVAQLHRVPLM